MQAFAQLFADLDRSPRPTDQVAALEAYFRQTPPSDAAWALWFLSGQCRKRAVTAARLRQWAAESAELPLWLVEACYEHVGDLAETLALLLPASPHPAPLRLAQVVEQRLLPLAGATVSAQRTLVRTTWAELDTPQRFLWHKLITGNFHAGVSRALLVRALADYAGVTPAVMAHRLVGSWQPTPGDFARLIAREAVGGDPAQPYPFHFASPLAGNARELGDVRDWQLEWKWNGIRVQLLRRAGESVLWSWDEECLTTSFPEVAEAASALRDGTVLEGELVAWRDATPLPRAQLQEQRERRQTSVAPRRQVPVVFLAYDVLERDGKDTRGWPLTRRRRELEDLVTQAMDRLARCAVVSPEAGSSQAELFPSTTSAPPPPIALRLSPVLSVASWDEAAALQQQARAAGAEGLVLKRRDSTYGVGVQPGTWWTWRVPPRTCHAVLVAAQPGQGRRAGRLTDYTFALWEGDELVPVAKAHSGLTDAEIETLDAFVRANTTGRFGPVRAVKPALVFELAFEGIATSNRRKSGLALRCPRIVHWRSDKQPAEASTVAALRQLAEASGAG